MIRSIVQLARWMGNATMERRAHSIAARVSAALPDQGAVLDIGSGTGHNAQALARRTGLQVVEADVTDLSMVGTRAIRFERVLPFRSGAFMAGLLIFVLQYCENPPELLREVARVAGGRVLVLQTTSAGRLGHAVICLEEIIWGPLAFLIARAAGLIGPARFTLGARRHYTRALLLEHIQQAGLRVRAHSAHRWPLVAVSDDLYVLEDAHASAARQDDLGDHPGPQ
jgi:ubiquinone/menaquinone biosynthesis C-methylase UbiE